MYRTAVAGVVVSVLLAGAGTASAREPAEWGPYVAADIGNTVFAFGKERVDRFSEVPSGDSRLDRGDGGYSLAAGFRFSPHWAVEATYLDLGRSSYLVADDTGTAVLAFGSRGAAVSVLGTWPINHSLALEGRAGLYLSNANFRGWFSATFDLTDGDLESLEGAGGGNPGLLLGGGIVASLGRHWAVRLGYDYLRGNALDVRSTALDASLDSSAGRLSVGVRYLFR